MFDLIFGTATQEMIITIAVIVAVCFVVWLFAKYDSIRKVSGYLCLFILLVSAVFSFNIINTRYGSKGGIVGQITSIFNPNQVEVEPSELKFNFKNVMMVKDADGIYRAEFTSADKLELKPGEIYAMYINGDEIQHNEYSDDYIISEYTYVFYDRTFGEIASDKMKLQFAFYGKTSYLSVEVENGEQTNELWNSYFNKEGFEVQIKPVEESYIANNSMAKITLNSLGENYKTIGIKKGSIYSPPELEKNGYQFNGWKLEGSEEFISEAITITENITLNADWTKIHSVNYRYNFFPQISPDINSDSIRVDEKYRFFLDGEELRLPEENPTWKNYTFVGWSLDGKTVQDFEGLNVTEDMTIFAVWKAKTVQVHINTNGGSVELNNNLFGAVSEPELFIDFDEIVSFSNPSCENRELAYFLISFNEQWFSGTTIRGYKLTDNRFDCQTIYSILNSDNTPSISGGVETTPAPEVSKVYIYAIWTQPENQEDWTISDYQKVIGSWLGMFSTGSDKYSETLVGEVEETKFSQNVANCYGFIPTGTTAEEIQSEVLNKLKTVYKISDEKFSELMEQGFYKAMYEILFNLGEQN